MWWVECVDGIRMHAVWLWVSGPTSTVVSITWVIELQIGWFKFLGKLDTQGYNVHGLTKGWITQFGVVELKLWPKQCSKVQLPRKQIIHLLPFNSFNSSHASNNLFLLPTHNSTYHLTSTTKDLRTNLGFKALSSWRTWRTPYKTNHQNHFFCKI